MATLASGAASAHWYDCDLSWVMTFERNGDNRSNVPVVALRLPPANFSNRFAVMHTNYNYVHNITNLAIDSTRAHDLSLNPDSLCVLSTRA